MTARYVPSTIDELADLLENSLLVEGHYTDFKRELGPNANKGLAKDIAAFAIDGGHLYIGVDEGEPGSTPVVSPVSLAGLKERIDQIARTAVTPPVAVRCTELPDSTAPEQGCLIVEVPPSPEAPHQATERFWGRGDTTNHVLSPSEVDALYERRARRTSQLDALLDAEIERDPTPGHLREYAHVFVVAEPLSGDDELLHRALGGQRMTNWISGTLTANVRPSVAEPDLPSASSYSRRADGAAAHSYYVTPDRGVQDNGTIAAQESRLIDLEVLEDGGIRLFNGRGSDTVSDVLVAMDAVIASSVLRVLETATAVSAEASYFGQWYVGVAITNLRGAVSYTASQELRLDPTGYSSDEYRRSGIFGPEDINEITPVLERLVGPLLRSLGSPYKLNGRHGS